jgi:hypothetical protein
MIRAAVPFLIGRGVAGSPAASAAGALGEMGAAGAAAGEVGRDILSGVVSQQPNAPRLSNVIDQVMPNFVTDWLKAKPEDENTLLGHLKAGLEFAGLGQLFSGASRALSALKAEPDLAELGKGATPGAGPPGAAAEAAKGGSEGAATAAAPERDILALGNPLEPAVTIRSTPAETAMADVTLGRLPTTASEPGAPVGEARPLGPTAEGVPAGPTMMSEQTIHDYLAGQRVDNPVKVNLGRIGSGEDIASVLEQVSKTIPQQAIQTNEATVAAADALGLTPQDFLGGYKGQNLNAADTTAMRFVLDSSANQLLNFAEAARSAGTPEAQAQFLKAFTVHRSLQQYFENARAEAGRTLQSWSIMSTQRGAAGRAISDLVNNADANGDLSALAEKVADLGDPLKANRFVAEASRSGRDMFLKVWYNSLLSGRTIVKKLASDAGMAAWNIASTYAASRLPNSSIDSGEAGALAYGYIHSFGDAIRAGGKGLMAGQSQFLPDYATIDPARGTSPPAIAARFRLSALANGAEADIPIEQPSRAATDYVRALLPTSWIAGADDFAKVWNYRAELGRLAYRQADGDPQRLSELLNNPPQALSQQAVGAALRNTFQEPLSGIAQTIANAVDELQIPIKGTDAKVPLGRIIMPFTKVPVNIARTAYRQSPLAYLLPSDQMRAAIARPGPQRDIALATMGLGTGLTLSLADLALNNTITGRGPSNPDLNREWQAAGNQPYSLQIEGARPVQLNQLEPFGMTMGAVADTFNLLKFANEDADAWPLATSVAFGVGNAMMSKTYFEGVSRFLDTLQHSDRSDPARFSAQLASSFVPNTVGSAARAIDPWVRTHYSLLDAVEAKLPWVSKSLPPARTVWGDPIPVRDYYLPFLSGTSAAEMVSPLSLGKRPEDVEPIDRWLWDNKDESDYRVREPGRNQSFSSGTAGVSAHIQLTPEETSRLQQLGGNELRNPDTGLGLKDTLNALVQGNYPDPSTQRQWTQAAPAAQMLMVGSMVNKFRQGAKQQLRQEFPELDRLVQQGWTARAQALTQPATTH